MIKLLDLLTEIQEEQQIDEGWRENVVALATAAASLVGGVKAQGQDVLQKTSIANTQQVKQTKDTLDINFGTNFQSGRYSFNQKDVQDLSSKLATIGNFIKNHPNSDFKISIVSSESKVPNYDLEPTSSNFKSRLDTGELAQKRATSMRVAIETLISKLKEEGIKVGNVSFDSTETLIGGPEWKQGMSSSDPKFTEHQFVKFKIVAKDKSADFSAFAKRGESMFDERGHLAARIFYRTRETSDITKQGGMDTGYEDVLVRFVDGSKFSGENYLVNGRWWNKNAGTSVRLDQEFKEKIKQNGKFVEGDKGKLY